MSHGPHPSILEHGLADGCERCSEIAADPFIGLDDDNLRALILRTELWMGDDPDSLPRSDNEHRAMRAVESTIVRQRKIQQLFEFERGTA